LRRILRLKHFVGALVATSLLIAEPAKPPIPEEELVSKYVEANQQQQNALRGGTLELDIDATVPKLKKQGKLHALKNISKLGKITYHALGFGGDSMVKTEVIARYLAAEVQANQENSNYSVTPQNYKFKYKGMEEVNGRTVYVLHVNPREKRVGLFKGELWLDAETYLPVREMGALVKSPSIFLKKMQFVREYAIENGVSTPQRIESKVETRFFGPVELNVNFLSTSRDQSVEVGQTSSDHGDQP